MRREMSFKASDDTSISFLHQKIPEQLPRINDQLNILSVKKDKK